MSIEEKIKRIHELNETLNVRGEAVPVMASVALTTLGGFHELSTPEEKLDWLRALVSTTAALVTMAGADLAEILGDSLGRIIESGEQAVAQRAEQTK